MKEVFSVWEKLALFQDQCSSVQFPARSTFVPWLRNTPFTAHLLHTPTPNTLFPYEPDNNLNATHLSYWLPFSQIKLLIAYESPSHSALFPTGTADFLELRSQKYSVKKTRFLLFLSFSSSTLQNCSFSIVIILCSVSNYPILLYNLWEWIHIGNWT